MSDVLSARPHDRINDRLHTFAGFRDKTFLEYLNTKNLTPIVQHYVVQAIAMATDKTSCRDGVNRTKHFLNSLGRYGNTPFLWPMYGSGELPQCFCRYAPNRSSCQNPIIPSK